MPSPLDGLVRLDWSKKGMEKFKIKGFDVYGTSRKTMPDVPGLWFLSCCENDNNYEPVAIIQGEECLMLCDMSLGVTPLDILHNNIIEPRWMQQTG